MNGTLLLCQLRLKLSAVENAPMEVTVVPWFTPLLGGCYSVTSITTCLPTVISKGMGPSPISTV
jgi:hypothetical protein